MANSYSSSKTELNNEVPTTNNTSLHQTTDNDDDDDATFLAATQLLQSGTLPMAVKAAVELNIFGIMAEGGRRGQLSPAEIAAKLSGCRNPDAASMLDRLLRLLACHSVVTCAVTNTVDGGVERRYGLGRMSELFVRDDNGISLGPFMSLVEDPVVRASWEKFSEAILEGGIPFNKMYGVHAFDYPGLDPRFNQVFNAAMFNYTTIITKKIIEKYKGFEGVKQLVDVGGGLGHTLDAITSMYPSIKGINFDLPHVICNAHSYPGVEHLGGDMFESVPQGDAIFMKWILHDWSDDHCLTILKNCHKAIPDHGKVIVVESILKEEPETTNMGKVISQMDVYMMNKNPGGKERTHQEFVALAGAAGFTKIQMICRACQFWVIEFRKELCVSERIVLGSGSLIYLESFYALYDDPKNPNVTCVGRPVIVMWALGSFGVFRGSLVFELFLSWASSWSSPKVKSEVWVHKMMFGEVLSALVLPYEVWKRFRGKFITGNVNSV